MQVKLVTDPTFEEFKATLQEFQPTLLYVAGSSSYEQNSVTGLVGPVQFRGEMGARKSLARGVHIRFHSRVTSFKGFPLRDIHGVKTIVHISCRTRLHTQTGCNRRKHSRVLARHAIVWPEGNHVPAVVAAQFSHTFFSAVLSLKSSIHEAFALANHVVQAHCTTITDNQYLAPSLPSLYSPIKATLPDNSSIPSPSIPGVDTAMGLALAVPGMQSQILRGDFHDPFGAWTSTESGGSGFGLGE
eukprot:1140104-Pelagomonas_calceolata.AAC.5